MLDEKAEIIFKEKLSALVDNEADDEDIDYILEHIVHNKSLLKCFDRYQLIRDVICKSTKFNNVQNSSIINNIYEAIRQDKNSSNYTN